MILKKIKENLNKGQHFLIDKEALKQEIKSANLSSKDKVIEIGVGQGILTQELARKSGEVLGFEIDKRYKKYLKLLEEKYPNLRIIHDNAINYPWNGYNKIVSNIPYYLGEKIISKSVIDNIPFLVLIVGENFKSLLMKKKTKSGIITNVFYEIAFIKKIDKKSFFPRPRVNSWLIKLIMKKENIENKMMRYILSKKGKIKNAIIYAFVNGGFTKKKSKEILEGFNIDERILEKPVSRLTGNLILRINSKIREIFSLNSFKNILFL